MQYLVKLLLNLNTISKYAILVIIDIFLVNLSFILSFLIIFNSFQPQLKINIILFFIIINSINVLIFSISGFYKSLTRYLDIDFFWLIFKGSIFYIFTKFSIYYLLVENHLDYRVFIINFLLLILFISLSRFILKKIITYFLNNYLTKENAQKKLFLIYGLNEEVLYLIDYLRKDQNNNIIGIIDELETNKGRNINGIRIYSIDEILKFFDLENLDYLIIPENISIKKLNYFYEIFEKYKTKIQKVPNLSKILSNKTEPKLQDIEIENFLYRETVKPFKKLYSEYIKNKVILITGAGGSIGFEISKKINDRDPKKLIVIDKSEENLFNLKNYLLRNNIKTNNSKIYSFLLDLTDSNILEDIFNNYKPQIVFHCAAYKHVEIVEANPLYALKNNIISTLNILKCSSKFNVSNFVLISSDKAVRPANIMGVSKRFSELLVNYYNSKNNITNNYCSVRFGNVLGSSGSVIPIFKDQIKNGGPVLVTDRKVKRFFMTIKEAAELVIQSASLIEKNSIFILDMGKSVSIDNIAKKIIKLSGLNLVKNKTNNNEIEIKYIGLKKGEKLNEELSVNNNLISTIHPKIFMEKDISIDVSTFENDIDILVNNLENNKIDMVEKILNKWIEK